MDAGSSGWTENKAGRYGEGRSRQVGWKLWWSMAEGSHWKHKEKLVTTSTEKHSDKITELSRTMQYHWCRKQSGGRLLEDWSRYAVS